MSRSNPWVAVMGLLALAGTFHETATVDATATLGTGAYADAGAFVGAYATVGDRSTVGARASIASASSAAMGTTLGTDSVLGRRTTVGIDTDIGSDVITSRAVTIGSGVVTGDNLTIGYASSIASGATVLAATVGAQVTIGDAFIGANVVLARGVTVGDGATIEAGAIIGPDVTIAAGAFIGAGARIRKDVSIEADARIEGSARIGRGVRIGANAVVADSAVIRARSNIGTYQSVSGFVARETVMPDLPPPSQGIVIAFNGRTWADGSVASSCDEYLNAPDGFEYSGDIGDGRYNIKPTPQISTFPVYCDMDEGSMVGWTLVAKVDRVRTIATTVDEPNGWFGLGSARNPSLLLDTVSRDSSPTQASHGGTRMQKMFEAGLSQARFTVIAEDDPTQRGTWYKSIVDDTFLRWFSTTAHTATQVCTNQAMTTNCSTDTIRSTDTTRLGGMTLAHFGYSATGELHMRQNGDSSPSPYSGVCSFTFDEDGNAWRDDVSSHWGNGLEIWVR